MGGSLVYAEGVHHGLQPEQEFGLLLAPDLGVEKSHSHFGVSVEWCRDSQQRGCARFLPEMVDWSQMKQAPDSPPKPEQELQYFHEAMLHQFLPGIRPGGAEVAERLPAAALLVLLEPRREDDVRGVPRLSWEKMNAVTIKERHKDVERMLIASCKGDGGRGRHRGTVL